MWVICHSPAIVADFGKERYFERQERMDCECRAVCARPMWGLCRNPGVGGDVSAPIRAFPR